MRASVRYSSGLRRGNSMASSRRSEPRSLYRVTREMSMMSVSIAKNRRPGIWSGDPTRWFNRARTLRRILVPVLPTPSKRVGRKRAFWAL